MKRLTKALFGVLIGTAALCSVAAFTACNPAHTHDWEDDFTVDTPATCTEDGSKSIHCKDCDETKDVTVIPAGHIWADDFTVDEASTCTTDGSKSIHCVNCEATKDVTPIPAAHSWEEDYTVDTPATCTKPGVKSYHCKNCEEISGVTPIAPLEHDPSPWKVEAENTPTLSAGGKAIRVCTRTGCEAVVAEHELPPLTSEDYTVTVITPSTCKTVGSATYAYDKDGVSVSFTGGLDLLPHAFGDTVDTTDKSTGEIVGYTCTECGAVDNDNSYIYMGDSVLGNSNLSIIDVTNYYFEITQSSNGYICLQLDLSSPGIYEINIEHLKGTGITAAIDQVLFDGDTDKKVVYATRGGGSVQSSYESVATIENTEDRKQTNKFTFDASNASKYVGHYLKIRFNIAQVPTFTMAVSKHVETPVINDGETISNLTVPCKTVVNGETYGGVTIVEVGDVEEATYVLTVTLKNTLMRSMLFFGKGIEPDYLSIYGPETSHGMGGTAEVIIQNMQINTYNGADYKVAGAGTRYTIELTLKKGDKLVLAHSNTVDGALDISMAKKV